MAGERLGVAVLVGWRHDSSSAGDVVLRKIECSGTTARSLGEWVDVPKLPERIVCFPPRHGRRSREAPLRQPTGRSAGYTPSSDYYKAPRVRFFKSSDSIKSRLLSTTCSNQWSSCRADDTTRFLSQTPWRNMNPAKSNQSVNRINQPPALFVRQKPDQE